MISDLSSLEIFVAILQMTIGTTPHAYQKRSDTRNRFTEVHVSLMKVELGIDNSRHSKEGKSYHLRSLGTKLFNLLQRSHHHH